MRIGGDVFVYARFNIPILCLSFNPQRSRASISLFSIRVVVNLQLPIASMSLFFMKTVVNPQRLRVLVSLFSYHSNDGFYHGHSVPFRTDIF